jgi:hypothetical protein
MRAKKGIRQYEWLQIGKETEQEFRHNLYHHDFIEFLLRQEPEHFHKPDLI